MCSFLLMQALEPARLNYLSFCPPYRRVWLSYSFKVTAWTCPGYLNIWEVSQWKETRTLLSLPPFSASLSLSLSSLSLFFRTPLPCFLCLFSSASPRIQKEKIDSYGIAGLIIEASVWLEVISSIPRPCYSPCVKLPLLCSSSSSYPLPVLFCIHSTDGL